MKITYTNITAERRSAIEADFERHTGKLSRFLKHYDPDSIELRSSLEELPKRNEYDFSLNLILPTGTLHATGAGSDVLKSVKAAFAEIEAQVKKHQQKLRKDYVWKRKRGRAAPKLSEVAPGD